MTKPDTRPTVHLKLDRDTLAELHALAARDRIQMTTWIKAHVRETFRRLPKSEQDRWLKQDTQGGSDR